MTSRKNELLAKVMEYDEYRFLSAHLASQVESREQVEAMTGQFTQKYLQGVRQLRTYVKASYATAALFVVAHLAGLLDMAQVVPRVSNFLLFGAVLACLWVVGYMWIGSKEVETLPELNELRPLANTSDALLALQWIEKGDPLVLEWRALALKERGALYQFDLSIIAGLAKGAEADRRRAEQAEREEAIRAELRAATERLHALT